jgi:hypothetical protein
MVDRQKAPPAPSLLARLGLGEYRETGKVAGLWETFNARTLYIAHYNNVLVFAHPELPFEFFYDPPRELEQKFIACFPDCRIAALIQTEAGSVYGFCVIVNGKRVRVKDSWGEDPVDDFGSPFPEEEAEYISFSERLDAGERQDIIEEAGERGLESYLRFSAAWGMPNVISKSFLGEYVGAMDDKKMAFVQYDK